MTVGAAWRTAAIASAIPVLGLCSCGGSDAAAGAPIETPVPELELVREQKLSDLLPQQVDHFEASGVTHRDGFLYIVFDNSTNVAVVNVSLSNGSLSGWSPEDSQYEGITFDSYATPHFYVMKETDGDDPIRGRVIQLDESMAPQSSEWTDVTFSDANVGFEGLAWLRALETDFLLALCEGNHCEADRQTVGAGRIKVLQQDNDGWKTRGTLAIPPVAAFADFSDVALLDRGDGTYSIAVVSQESSALWVGVLSTDPFAIDGDGETYALPRRADGSSAYCAVEGVTFLTATSFAMVSDRSSGGEGCQAKDESVHVFALP